MPDTPFFDFEINIEDMLSDIEVIENTIEETEAALDQLEKNAVKSVYKTISIARMGWGLIQGMIRAGGGAISMTQRLVLSAGMGAIQAMAPILSVALKTGIASLNAAQILAAAAGIAELGTALAAMWAFEAGQREMSLKLRGLNFMMSNMGMMLTTITL